MELVCTALIQPGAYDDRPTKAEEAVGQLP